MTLVDSCGWLAYFKGGSQGAAFAPYITSGDHLVPTIVLYEVYRVLKRDAGGAQADAGAALLRGHRLVDLDHGLALAAAEVGLEHRLATADAIVYATARLFDATLVTGDDHFAGLPGVEYIPAPPAAASETLPQEQ